MGQSLMSTYSRLPVTFARGQGVWLWDAENRRYLDAISGIAVCGLGHAHPGVTAALCEQAGRLVHTSNLYHIAAQQQLGDRLTRLAGMERVFFGNSGAEANEAAIKLARLRAHQRGIKDPIILVMESSFHGRTLATLTATGNRKAQAGFEPLVPGFARVPYNDIDAIDKVAASRASIVAVLVEPILGEGGVILPAANYLRGLRELCDQHDWLLMLDEIQTGMGRTGRLFAFQHADILPDVLTLAKGLANGVPIGACLAQGEAAEILGPGSHGSTFGGNPLACSAALAVLRTLEQDNLPAQATRQGQALLEQLRLALGDLPGVREVRGLGLMIGIELERDCMQLTQQALDQGLLINVTAGRVVRLLPPLIIDDEQIALLTDGLTSLIRGFLADAPTEAAE
ncbi:Acetylornithine aminotransferase [Thiorhodovibrio winogradskyi]|uniref:Acetylornithine aminotransferase n=1 Tax=Thiorhodovibrio winogradskyi TaxID=77007 RepID=A0ABZ0S5Q5_9GAMM|nr:aspartate aminotransferase family protein [Thiorhodovibrio winogradskyi]